MATEKPLVRDVCDGEDGHNKTCRRQDDEPPTNLHSRYYIWFTSSNIFSGASLRSYESNSEAPNFKSCTPYAVQPTAWQAHQPKIARNAHGVQVAMVAVGASSKIILVLRPALHRQVQPTTNKPIA